MRVLLADKRQDVRSALRLLLEQNPDIVVIGEATRADELVAQAAASCPDVVLADCELPGAGTAELLSILRSFCSHLKVIILSSRPEQRAPALAAGADFFVSKVDAPEALLSVLKSLLS